MVCVLTFHHIACDEWLVNILLAGFRELFIASQQGRVGSISELAIQYADFALWQQSRFHDGELSKGEDFWRQMLAGVPSRPLHQLQMLSADERACWSNLTRATPISRMSR